MSPAPPSAGPGPTDNQSRALWAGWRRVATEAVWSRWVPVLFVPVVVGAAHLVAASSFALRFLLVPPLAVLAERGASEPHAPSSGLPSMVVGPAVGAVLGTATSIWIGPGAGAFVLLTLVMMLLLRLMRWQLPPALAIALLALVLQLHTFWYPLDVLAATAALWLCVRGLLRLRQWLRWSAAGRPTR